MCTMTFSWDRLRLFHSASTTQQYLKKNYRNRQTGQEDADSFNNCVPFIYYLENGETYYQQAMHVPLAIQPILLFYGYVQLIKACLLVVDPAYPSSSALLAHGVTTRKRKKQHYSFLQDEVKIQRNGLFSHMAEVMFHMKHLDGEKISMKHLLSEIPEMAPAYSFFRLQKYYPLQEINNRQYRTPSSLLDSLHKTAEGLQNYLNKEGQANSYKVQEEKDNLLIYTEKKLSVNRSSPFRFNASDSTFQISGSKETRTHRMEEMLIHYLLLYNLSMIARYETEWWLDLLKTAPNEDYPLISQFLNISLFKGPFLISEFLLEHAQL